MNESIVCGDATLYCGDFADLLPSLKDVDALIVDPPYFNTDLPFDQTSRRTNWADFLPVVKDDGYLAVFAPFDLQSEILPFWKVRFSGCWLKTIPVNRTHSAKKPFGSFELFTVYAHPNHQVRNLTWNKVFVPGTPYRSVKNRYKTIQNQRGNKDQLERACTSNWTKENYVLENDGTRHQTDVIVGPNKIGMKHAERTAHPTQKPLNVMETLVRWLTNPGDLIFDPYMGSGSTGVAALKLGRRFVGAEINPEYFAIARRRIEDAQQQLRMAV